MSYFVSSVARRLDVLFIQHAPDAVSYRQSQLNEALPLAIGLGLLTWVFVAALI
jgi:hypothetical protein